jgi:RNA polymerase sigma-70 factor (ECF subfamily)
VADLGAADFEQLLQRAREGDEHAKAALLGQQRARLCKLVTMRIDKRMAARLDPSDVVQDAMQVAHQRFGEFLQDPGRPFYVWLRGITLDRLVETYRRHVEAQKRSVLREQPGGLWISGESEHELANKLVTGSLSPGSRLLQAEMLARVQQALTQLAPADREVLVLRHLEQLSVEEIAHVLGITKVAATTRHFRALERLREVMGEESDD